MSNVSNYVRIFRAQPDDDLVEKRGKAIADLALSMGKQRNIIEILEKASDVAGAFAKGSAPSEHFAAEVEAAIQKHSPSFIRDREGVEIAVWGGVAALDLLESTSASPSGLGVAEVLAAGLWSALGFQAHLPELKMEELRSHLLRTARTRILVAAEAARRREEVPDFGALAVDGAALEKLGPAFKKSTATTVTNLRRNAALDREEIDLLWWALADRSRLLGRPLASLAEPARAVAAGIDAAALLRKLPCDAHRELVLRSVSNTEKLNLRELLAVLGDDRSKLGHPFADSWITRMPRVFPLLMALVSGQPDRTSDLETRTTEDWGARALLEAGIFHIASGHAGIL